MAEARRNHGLEHPEIRNVARLHGRQIMLADDQRTAMVNNPQLGGGTDRIFPAAQQMELRDEARVLIDDASVRHSIWHRHGAVADKSR